VRQQRPFWPSLRQRRNIHEFGIRDPSDVHDLTKPNPAKEDTVVAITVRDRDEGVAGLSLTEMPYPIAGENDVIVRVRGAGFNPTELEWTGTWADRAGRDRTPSIVGHDLSGVVAELGPGTTGLTVGQRVFGLTDWFRNGTLAEYTAVEARNLAPLPADVDHVTAALPISGLTSWQALFDHAHLRTGQSVLIHGAAGGVASIAVQLAREEGAVVIGTGRPPDRDTVLGLGAHAFWTSRPTSSKMSVKLTWSSMRSMERFSIAPPHWCAPAARSSPSSGRPRSSQRTGVRSTSSSNLTASGSRSLPNG
jgi:D-arabinose 1-dehydrogenase-like Zn-dependent alcohol dehydrogenase